MNKQDKTYLIDGNLFDRDGLLSFCYGNMTSPDTPGWEREIWEFILEWLSPNDELEVQTSGSTGEPKRIKLSKVYMAASARLTLKFFGLKHRDPVLLCLSVKYIAGKMMVVRALTGGLNLLLSEPSSAPDFRRFGKISFSAMVPMQVSELLAKPDGRIQLEKIETLIIGGSFIDKTLENELKNLKNNIWQTYGMTETISHIALRKLNGRDASEWYKPLPGVELKKDERGCLVITAPHIGVQNLVTNDLVEFNDKRAFKVLGRVDNVVISGGVKLFPEKIEQKLSGKVENEFFLAGLPDDKLGEKLVMFIESESLNPAGKDQLWKTIKNTVSGYEVPKEFIFLNNFERNEQGKVLRKKTADKYASSLFPG